MAHSRTVADIDTRRTTGGPRYDVRFRDPDGRQRKKSFRTKKEAERFAATCEADRWRGQWVDPAAGKVILADYASTWLRDRPRPLRSRTQELYEGLLRLHVLPVLGGRELARLAPADIRSWHSGLVRSTAPGSVVPAKAYRLLRAIMSTAVEDEQLARNPCLVRGAGIEKAAERPIATPSQVRELAELVDARFRVLVLLAGFMGLRLGELLGLQRRDLVLSEHLLIVERQLQELKNASFLLTTPKTEAGRRSLAIPSPLVPELQSHLDTYTGIGDDAFVFVGEKGGPVRRAHWNMKWRAAVSSSSLPSTFRFHDLRHTANTLAATTPGISTKDLMYRLGHASSRAALLYQHATSRQDALIADRIGQLARPSDREHPGSS